MILAQHWWWIIQALIAIACLLFAGVGIYIASKRRQWLVFSMIGFAVLMIALAAMQIVSIAWAATPAVSMTPWIALLGAVAGIAGALSLGLRIRALLSQPTREQALEMNAALERANRELEAFTASVSHDLRSPLTTIAGQAGLLEISAGAKLDEDQKRRLHRIHASVKQMSELIEALLNLSRISQLKLERKVIDISATAEHIVSDLAQREPARQVDIRIARGLSVYGDQRLVISVLETLLSNAWKFTSKTPQALIEVNGGQHHQQRGICVRDNGCGFEMSQHDKLFHPFQRLHTQAEFPGSGIGLATASRIIARHGGRLWAEAKPGEGAAFWFTVG
jgi:light-regulated signal transduction histidine kinase (bacteriophytochrome)